MIGARYFLFSCSLAEEERRKRTSSVAKERSVKAQRKQFESAWLSVMRLPLTPGHYKTILTKLHTQILPHMQHPLMLMDWLSESYEAGGITSILALNALFELITKHNLDYPSFYPKLYSLLTVCNRWLKRRVKLFIWVQGLESE